MLCGGDLGVAVLNGGGSNAGVAEPHLLPYLHVVLFTYNECNQKYLISVLWLLLRVEIVVVVMVVVVVKVVAVGVEVK